MTGQGAPAPETSRAARFALGPITSPLLCALLALVSILPGLGDSPLSRTEPHRAIPAHEMVISGDWLIPRLYGVPYIRKPPLHCWLLGASETIFGSTSEWVYRLPSVLSAALIAVVACASTRRWFGPKAGLVAGLATLALVAPWGQYRSADVDAPNALFAFLGACALFEGALHRGAPCDCIRRVFDGGVRTAVAGLAIGAALLVKGPAALTVLVGAAVALLWFAKGSRRRELLHVLAAFALGAAIFSLWAVFALARLRATGDFDWSGLTEVASRAGEQGTLFTRLAMPLLISIAGLPITIAAPVSLLRSTRAAFDAPRQRLIIALALAWSASLLAGVVGGVDHLRYAYITLPLVAPLAGAVAAAWTAGAYRGPMTRLLRQALTGTALSFGAVIIMFATLLWHRDAAMILSWFAMTIGAPLTVVSVLLWIGQRALPAAIATMALALLCALSFTDFRNASRRAIASTAAATTLRELVEPEALVISGRWVFTGPELFWYSGISPRYEPAELHATTAMRGGDWLVFHRDEWDRWTPSDHERFDRIVELPVRSSNALAVRVR